MSLFPFVSFDPVPLEVANDYLDRWAHKMGPINRPMNDSSAYALMHEGRPVAVTVHSGLIREQCGGGLGHLTRSDTIELSRLCADRPHLCRVALRLWREFVFTGLGASAAISYQDAELHNGATYRFDGWARSPEKSRSGSDLRSKRGKGRTKWIWVWPPEALESAP